MGFQEKYEEYKQRKEAQKFFNQNNDYHLDPIDYVKLLLIGTLVGTIVAIIFQVIQLQLSVGLSIFYLFTGYAVGYTVLKVAKYGSDKTGIICIVCYFLSLWLGASAVVAYAFSFYHFSIPVISCLQAGFKSLFQENLFTYLFIFAGAFIAYSVGKD